MVRNKVSKIVDSFKYSDFLTETPPQWARVNNNKLNITNNEFFQKTRNLLPRHTFVEKPALCS